MSERELHDALVWALKHGVKAVDWCTTGYWHHQHGDGSDIMPPAEIHIVLDKARTAALLPQ